MNCTVGVVRTRIEASRQFNIVVPPSNLGICFREFLETGLGSDIVFEVGDETFKAHKLILAARSPVFKAQFFGLIGDPNMKRVVVEDIQPLVFKVSNTYWLHIQIQLFMYLQSKFCFPHFGFPITVFIQNTERVMSFFLVVYVIHCYNFGFSLHN